MHLDTVFTMLDRDIVTLYPKVAGELRAISLRPGRKEGDFHVTVEKDFLSAVQDALGVKKLTVVETEATSTSKSESNGTTPTTPSLSSLVSSSPMSAIPTRSKRCETPGSR